MTVVLCPLADGAEDPAWCRFDALVPGSKRPKVFTFFGSRPLFSVISDSSDGTTRSDRPIGWHIGGFSPYSADFSSVPELINYYQANTLNIKGTKGLLLHSTTKR